MLIEEFFANLLILSPNFDLFIVLNDKANEKLLISLKAKLKGLLAEAAQPAAVKKLINSILDIFEVDLKHLDKFEDIIQKIRANEKNKEEALCHIESLQSIISDIFENYLKYQPKLLEESVEKAKSDPNVFQIPPSDLNFSDNDLHSGCSDLIITVPKGSGIIWYLPEIWNAYFARGWRPEQDFIDDIMSNHPKLVWKKVYTGFGTFTEIEVGPEIFEWSQISPELRYGKATPIHKFIGYLGKLFFKRPDGTIVEGVFDTHRHVDSYAAEGEKATVARFEHGVMTAKAQALLERLSHLDETAKLCATQSPTEAIKVTDFPDKKTNSTSVVNTYQRIPLKDIINTSELTQGKEEAQANRTKLISQLQEIFDSNWHCEVIPLLQHPPEIWLKSAAQPGQSDVNLFFELGWNFYKKNTDCIVLDKTQTFYVPTSVKKLGYSQLEIEIIFGKQFDLITEPVYANTELKFETREKLESALALLFDNGIVNPLQVKVKGRSIYIRGCINAENLQLFYDRNSFASKPSKEEIIPSDATQPLRGNTNENINERASTQQIKAFLQSVVPQELAAWLRVDTHSQGAMTLLTIKTGDSLQANTQLKIFKEAFALLHRIGRWQGLNLQYQTCEDNATQWVIEGESEEEEKYDPFEEYSFDENSKSIALFIPENDKSRFLHLFSDSKQTARLLSYLKNQFAMALSLSDKAENMSNEKVIDGSLLVINHNELLHYKEDKIHKLALATAIEYFKSRGQSLSIKDIEQVLKSLPVTVTPNMILPAVFTYGGIETIKFFINNYETKLELNATFSAREHTSSHKINPLLLSVFLDKPELARFLLEKGADPGINLAKGDEEKYQKKSCTFFSLALEKFLEKKQVAWFNLCDELFSAKRLAPQPLLADFCLSDICKYRADREITEETLLKAANLCVNMGANINYVSDDSNPLIADACLSNNFSIAEFLLARGAELNAKADTSHKASVLDIIVSNLLAYKNKDISTTWPSEQPGKAKSRCVNALNFLLAKGAQASSQDKLKECREWLTSQKKSQAFGSRIQNVLQSISNLIKGPPEEERPPSLRK